MAIVLNDRQYSEFIKMVDEATRAPGVSRGIVGALVIAAGGKVTLTPEQILDALEGNDRFSAERVGVNCEIRAKARPRCEKCGRWERHD